MAIVNKSHIPQDIDPHYFTVNTTQYKLLNINRHKPPFASYNIKNIYRLNIYTIEVQTRKAQTRRNTIDCLNKTDWTEATYDKKGAARKTIPRRPRKLT